MTVRIEQNSLEGHSIRDLRTESAWKHRSASGYRDEEYEPSSEDPQQPPGGTNRPAQRILTYLDEFLEKP